MTAPFAPVPGTPGNGPPPPRPGRGLGVTALVLAAVSMALLPLGVGVIFWYEGPGYPLAALLALAGLVIAPCLAMAALTCGVVALSRAQSYPGRPGRGVAMTALGLATGTIVLSVVLVILAVFDAGRFFVEVIMPMG